MKCAKVNWPASKQTKTKEEVGAEYFTNSVDDKITYWRY